MENEEKELEAAPAEEAPKVEVIEPQEEAKPEDAAEENPEEKPQQEEEPKKKKSVLRRILSIASWVLIGLLVVADGFALYLKFSMGNENGGLVLFGKENRIVLTGSMNGTDEFYATEGANYAIKRIPVHSLVTIERAPDYNNEAAIQAFANSIQVNDIITFYHQIGETKYVVTHRVIEIDSSHMVFTCRGDNPEGDGVVSKYSPTQTVYADGGWLIGKVVSVNHALGTVIYAFVQNKIMLVFIIVVPSALMMIYEIGNIIFYFKGNKKEKIIEENTKKMSEKDLEIAKLREELEKLKKKDD